jgi:iodotyrosine deiodinase
VKRTRLQEAKMSEPHFVPLSGYHEYPPDEMLRRATAFYADMRRRSVRHFSDRPVQRSVIEQCLLAASTAPSGANLQPYHFVAISDDAVKRQIRTAAEEVERGFYEKRASEEWLDALAPLGTDVSKPFLEEAPFLIAVFAQRYGLSPEGERIAHYFVTESVGIAVGMLIVAIHQAGLVTLPYTPSPMGFLKQLVSRPVNERPVLLLPVGYPAEDAAVPDVGKKSLREIATFP